MTGDEEYEDQKLRRLLSDHDIRPLVKRREFATLHRAWNARLASGRYHRRNTNETVHAAIEQQFGAFVRSRRWWKRFRELVVEAVVYDLERGLASSHDEYDRS